MSDQKVTLQRTRDGWRSRIVGHGEEAPDQLLANPLNFRIHPKEQQDALAGVLNEVGWVQDVIVNQRTGHVIDGHLRVSLAISKEEPAVPVVYVDLDEHEERLVLATIDPLSAMAATDSAKLDELLREVSTNDTAVQAMLSELAESAGILSAPPAADDPGAQIDRADELREKWGTERGQLWEIGPHRLLCGDSTNADDVARLMDGKRAAMMWTDPPYGVSYVGKTAAAMTIENDDADDIPDLLDAVLRVADGVLEPGAPFYLASPAGTLATEFRLAVRRVGWKFHQALVWVKDAMVLGHSDYHYKHEDILYGWTQGPGRSGRGNHEGSRWNGDHAQTSVFMADRPKRSDDHPTEKPLDLVRPMIENSSKADDVVYEPFSGSGTTIVAAEQTSRICYGMEIEPKYVAVALERLAGMGLTPRMTDG